MLTRILIVVLVTFNFCVALWWIAKPSKDTSVTSASVIEGAPLELVNPKELKAKKIAPEPHSDNVAQPLQAQQQTVPTSTPDQASQENRNNGDDRCDVLGGFASKEAAEDARNAIADLGLEHLTLRQATSSTELYQVVLFINGDRAVAQNALSHLVAAGIHDMFLKKKHDKQWIIALGQYHQHDGALRRQTDIHATGMHPIVQRLDRPKLIDRWDLVFKSGKSQAVVKKRFPTKTLQIGRCQGG